MIHFKKEQLKVFEMQLKEAKEKYIELYKKVPKDKKAALDTFNREYRIMIKGNRTVEALAYKNKFIKEHGDSI